MAIANLGNLEMKKVLLGTTALLGVGLMAGTAAASEGIKLSLGGFYRTSYTVNFDDDNGTELGNDQNTDGLFTNGEVHFNGSLTMDNGLTAGVRIELEAEQEGDQIDESYVYFQGGFGTVRIGNDDSALQGACITPPGLTTNFGAFSPDNWSSNDGVAIGSGGAINAPTSNSVCFGVDNDATKLVYYSPSFGGFTFALSYTPDGGAEGDGAHSAHYGMGDRPDGSSQNNVSGYVSYGYEGEGWGLNIGGGADFVGRVDGDGDGDTDEQRADYYQTGVVLNFGGLSVGGAFQYYNDFGGTEDDGWVAGGGVSYNVDAWTVGMQYSHLEMDNTSGDDDFDASRDRIVLTGEYAMGPGISLDASLGYTWVDVSGADDGSDADNADNYDAFEIGIGTGFTF